MAKVEIFWINRGQLLFEQALQHYQKLLRPHMNLSIETLKPLTQSALPPLQIRRQEGERLMGRWAGGSTVVGLSPEGRLMDSLEFSRWLDLRLADPATLVFTIGGAHGLSDEVKGRCRELISFSPLTFSHELCLTVLLEQLYRACSILRNHPYHK
jgi:23S rRNA (pseudouridine1915-N3)-methyltransferase